MPHVGADELRLSPLPAELLGKLLASLAVASTTIWSPSRAKAKAVARPIPVSAPEVKTTVI